MAVPEQLGGLHLAEINRHHPDRGLGSTTSNILEQEQDSGFFGVIGRSDLIDVLTPQSPWIDFTMEAYSQEHGLLGGGGLGILKGDTAIEAQRLRFPLVIFTLFYPKRRLPSYYKRTQNDC